MAHLRPCDACLRHVRADVSSCPFCDHALAIDSVGPAEPTARVGRAARMAFGAAVATASLAAACGGNKPAETGGEKTTTTETTTTTTTTTTSASAAPTPSDEVAKPPPPPNNAKPYGAPPADGLLV